MAETIASNQAEIATLEKLSSALGPEALTATQTQQLSLLKQETASLQTQALSGLKTIIAASATVDGVQVGNNANSVDENGQVDPVAVLSILTSVSKDSGAAQYIKDNSNYERPGQTTTDPEAAANEASSQQQEQSGNESASNGSTGSTVTDPVTDPVVTTNEGENGTNGGVVDPATAGGEGGEGGAP